MYPNPVSRLTPGGKASVGRGAQGWSASVAANPFRRRPHSRYRRRADRRFTTRTAAYSVAPPQSAAAPTGGTSVVLASSRSCDPDAAYDTWVVSRCRTASWAALRHRTCKTVASRAAFPPAAAIAGGGASGGIGRSRSARSCTPTSPAPRRTMPGWWHRICFRRHGWSFPWPSRSAARCCIARRAVQMRHASSSRSASSPAWGCRPRISPLKHMPRHQETHEHDTIVQVVSTASDPRLTCTVWRSRSVI